MATNRRTFLQHAAFNCLPLVAPTVLTVTETLANTMVEPVLLTILFTNDLHGHVWHPGEAQGLVRLATIIRQVRREMPHVLLMDAGDMIHGSPQEKAFQGKPILDTMNAIGYDVATVGNHEFDFGQSVLRNAMAHAHFPLLSANVVSTETGEPWGGLQSAIVLQRGGIRIGVFGLTTPTTVQIEWPRTLQGIQFTDPMVAAQTVVDRLRTKESVDLVVALSHLGYPDDRILAEKVTGIDLILGAHSHTMLAEQVWIGNTLIAQTGSYGKALGRIDLLIEVGKPTRPGKVVGINGKQDRWWGKEGVSAPQSKAFPSGPLIKPDGDTAEDAAALAAYRPWSEKLRDTIAEVLIYTDSPLSSVGITSSEMAIGNLFADAIRVQTGSEIALMSSSQVTPLILEPGAITVADLYRVLGSYTRQHLVVAKVPGSLIASVLNRLRVGVGNGHFPVHLSEIRVQTDGSVIVGNVPLVHAKFYTVSSAAHVIQDYFYKKPGVEIVSDAVDAPTVRDAAINYLRGKPPIPNEIRFAPFPTSETWKPKG